MVPVEPVSNTTRLLVLGVVRIFQPVHGYDVRRELMSWHAADWASVAPGSIYNALKSLTRDGVLEVVDTNQVGGRPERTTYRLTARGEQEFAEMLRDTWWTVRHPTDPFAAGVALISFMKRDEAIAALEARIAHIQGQLEHAEHAIAQIDDVETPAHVRELMRLLNVRLGSEIAWARALIPLLRSGAYRLLGDPGPDEKPAAKKKRAPRRAKAKAKARKAAKAKSRR
ncbi:MAG: PadR family transcriptional regulator [Deltaproteobacteria bacterium]|nr:PadR family transcriptional regulator [Deltaproteobacteria bacterium]